MRLDQNLTTVSNIMRVAGRVPSRVQLYKEKMGLIKGTVPGRHKHAILAENFRQELMKKCSANISSIVPRIILSKVNTPTVEPGTFKSSKSSTLKTSSVVKQNEDKLDTNKKVVNFLLGFTFSYSVVMSLANYAAKGVSNGFVSFEKDSPVPDHAREVDEKGDSHLSNSTCNNMSASSSNAQFGNPSGQKRNGIAIVDSGKRVVLPHQSFKEDGDEFGDESLQDEVMDFEDAAELRAANGIFPSTSTGFDRSATLVKIEPEQSFMIENENTCNECRLELSSRAELEKHRAVIHKLASYVQCPTCKEMLVSYSLLKHHRKQSQICAIDEAAELREMEIIARPLFPYFGVIKGNHFCPMEGCFEVFNSDDSFTLHLKSHGSFLCSFCERRFEKGHELAIHETEQHSGAQFSGYKCSRCHYHVGGRYCYILHFMNSHLNISVFREYCTICMKGFMKGEAELTYHMTTHHDTNDKNADEIHKCNLCDAPFLKESQLSQHQMEIHNVERESKFKCTICSEVLPSSIWLRKHRKGKNLN